MFNFSKKKKQDIPKKALKQLEEVQQRVERLSGELETLKESSKLSVQKIEMVRYNPFSSVGGNQSFSVVVLDGNNTGIIITSLYSQEGNRVYGKRVKEGRPEHSLSGEEEKILNKAINRK